MPRTPPCLQIEKARRWHQRLLGLKFRRALDPGLALLLSPCNSVHTAFIRFAIDVVYLPSQWRVLAVRSGLRPWHMSCWASGGASAMGWQPGDELADALRPIKAGRWVFINLLYQITKFK